MLKNTLKTLDKKKLRRWLLLFFIALLIPSGLLIQQSYSRLKWETFHQHQQMALELSERIDLRLSELIRKEDQRPFTDYAFLNIAGDVSDSFLQRSPLSGFPVSSEIPGLMGYFQVDSEGQLKTPAVPSDALGQSASGYGVNPSELTQRLALQNQIQAILEKNQLIQKSNVAPQVDFSELTQAPSKSKAYTATLGRVEDLALQQSYQAAAKDEAALMQHQAQSSRMSKKSAPVKAEKRARTERNVLPEPSAPLMESLQVESMASINAFSAASNEAAPVEQRAMDSNAVAQPAKNLRIRTFESEIDPFEFSLLDSGHFVLFRKVWLNEQRYIQGLLIKQSDFLDALIKLEFSHTALSEMSHLLVAYQSNVLAAFSGDATGSLTQRYELMGEQLYQMRLSDPLSDMQLIYSITQLPMGVGGRVIVWLGLILAVVLVSGFYVMYRLGLSQINVLHQQQNFVSAVSHELKTPLTSIRMYGELLREGWASEEKKRSYYDFIFDESERLSRLINNVLQLARMTRNEQRAELRDCEVAELLNDIQAKISSQLERAQFQLVLDCDERIKSELVCIDTDWLTQIMINLVDNAIKFSAGASQKIVVLSCQYSPKQQLCFGIRDYGPGIDRAQMSQIFELFYRSEDELTRETTGTGIGLSLVHQMTQNMGGKVSVENKHPGAMFKVMFPLSKNTG